MSISSKQFNALAGELQLALNFEKRTTVMNYDRRKGFDLAVEAVIKFCKKENVRFDEAKFRAHVYNSEVSQ